MFLYSPELGSDRHLVGLVSHAKDQSFSLLGRLEGLGAVGGAEYLGGGEEPWSKSGSGQESVAGML